ncbi:hypothetical protein ALI22I_04905 [Saccharothrix sp. ALI-22-I]|uniref:hypothetical protein n=1 Tax=Saccharothrix sp. ALI-22-I TaxID=1933778 RepID=UPI00097C7558|nr:hypothetical protein [Saccharothrix sp. ALI-22-I]ONI92282.1 hypothetical protein ALI22I_04905 [Saccharothrix sp. ALI-22-I]
MNGSKTALRTTAVCLVATATLSGAAPTAHAAVEQSCLVNEVVAFSEPVTNTPKTVTVTVQGQLFNCTNDSAATGSYTETATLPNYTCTALFYQGSGTRVFTWTDPTVAPSTYSYNRTSSRVGANIVILLLGSTTSGTFTAEPTKMQLTALNPDPVACATTGVSQLTLLGALTVGV